MRRGAGVLALALCASLPVAWQPAHAAQADAGPPSTPERFAEGVISTPDYEYFTSFTPDVSPLILTLRQRMAVPLFLAGLTVLASWIPARRAARLAPAKALRQE